MTLGLYLSRLVAGRIVGAAFVLLALGVSIEALQQADELVEIGGAGALLTYAALSAPAMLATILPLAILIGGVSGFLTLGLRSELTVMRAAGQRAFALLRRLAPLALLLGAANHALVDRAPAWSAAAIGQSFAGLSDVPAPEVGDEVRARAAGQVVVARLAAPDATALTAVTIFALDSRGQVAGRLRADRATHVDGYWSLEGPHHLGETSGIARPDGHWRTPLTPADLRALATGNEVTTAAQAAAALSGAAVATRSAAYYATRLWRTRAAWAVPALMLLLSALASFCGARGTDGLGLAALGTVMGVGFVALDGMVAALGRIGILPPPAAALGPTLVVGGIGAAVLLARER